MSSGISIRHVPMRRCVACRNKLPKRQLTRFVKTTENKIHLDLNARQPGRGAYLCPSSECAFKARQKHLLERALKAALSVEAEIELKLRSDPQKQ